MPLHHLGLQGQGLEKFRVGDREARPRGGAEGPETLVEVDPAEVRGRREDVSVRRELLGGQGLGDDGHGRAVICVGSMP